MFTTEGMHDHFKHEEDVEANQESDTLPKVTICIHQWILLFSVGMLTGFVLV